MLKMLAKIGKENKMHETLLVNGGQVSLSVGRSSVKGRSFLSLILCLHGVSLLGGGYYFHIKMRLMNIDY